ncbi:hypothetical protein FIU83_10790 [Halomonas sp. THAF5a]|nr:hypothetical protein FIU83_10790 [Halomonas sp. THAF5a]
MTRYAGKVRFEPSALGGLCVRMEVPIKESTD